MPQSGAMGQAVPILFAMLALQACTPERGDFGRPKATVLSEPVFPILGHSYSPAPYTDDEEELRARAWRFLTPAKERWYFDRLVNEFARTRVIPPDTVAEGPAYYFKALMAEPARSPASRYATITDDAFADRKLIAPFAAVAARVEASDRIRLRTIAAVPDLTPRESGWAITRVQENRGLIAWVCTRLGARLESYRYALDHLVAAAPQREAVEAERSVLALADSVATLQAMGCVRPAGRPITLQDIDIRFPPDRVDREPDAIGPLPRAFPPDQGPPIVAKG